MFRATAGLVQCLFIKAKTIRAILENFPDEKEILERLATIRHRHFSRVRRETLKISTKGKRTIFLENKENNYNFRSAAAAAINSEEQIDPIKEALEKLEVTTESCEVNLPEGGEVLERNIPFRPSSTHGNITLPLY